MDTLIPLYLSRLRLTTRNRAVQTDLSDCHAMHRRLLLAFPNLGGLSDARNHFGVLYRIEPTASGVDILLQSTAAPDWSPLPDGYLREPAAPPKRVDPLYTAITAGQRLLFRLRANPTRRIGQRNLLHEAKWRGKRVELRREDDQRAWLQRKGVESGFIPLVLRASPPLPEPILDVRATEVSDHVIGRHPAGRLTLASVTFEGRIRVTDPDAFRLALWHGVGSGKAFGFGLLSIAPDPS